MRDWSRGSQQGGVCGPDTHNSNNMQVEGSLFNHDRTDWKSGLLRDGLCGRDRELRDHWNRDLQDQADLGPPVSVPPGPADLGTSESCLPGPLDLGPPDSGPPGVLDLDRTDRKSGLLRDGLRGRDRELRDHQRRVLLDHRIGTTGFGSSRNIRLETTGVRSSRTSGLGTIGVVSL